MSSRTIKTNPAYAALAYRKAIIHTLIYKLKRDCIGDSSNPPKEKLVSEDVFPVDGEVPVEEVALFVEELVDQKEAIELEMAKFEFTRKKSPTHEPTVHSQEAQSKQGSRKEGGKRSS